MAGAEETSIPDRPSLPELVVKVVSACTDRKGLSFYALKMALASEGYDFKLHLLKRSVLALVRNGELIQTNKCGLNGRLKAPKPEKVSKKKAAEAKEPKAKKSSEKKEPKKPRKPRNAVVVTLE